MAKKNVDFDEKLKNVPEKPGVYFFKNGWERILYIGKAKNLKSRLKSYFQKSLNFEPRKTAMLRNIRDFNFIVAETEVEALALEANLIKQHRPRFNVLLRDDKNYPYLKLTVNEEWPRLEVVRSAARNGAIYFGPYIPASSIWDTLAFIRKHFNIRPCRYRLDRPMRPCVQYQMGRCLAPCAGLVLKEEYLKAVKEVEQFLKGEKRELIEELETRMYRFSDELRFEEASQIRDRLKALKIAFESQRVVAPELGDIDVIGFYQKGIDTVFQVLFIRNGMLISGKDFYLKDKEFISKEELFERFIELFYAEDIVPPKELLVQALPEGLNGLINWLSEKRGGKVLIKIPQKGKKIELLRMATENAKATLLSRKAIPIKDVIRKLKERLELSHLPESIGAFDVSTTFGSHSVGAFIWWEDGKFRKELYRHLHIKEVKGINDYSMMREIVTRTLKHLGGILPNLIIIDGGKGHLEVALRTIKEEFGDDIEVIDIIGITKGPDRAVLKNGKIIPLDDSRPDALLLRRIRDEVHRFAVSFHRKLRSKGFLESRLEHIKGIGKKRRLALLKRFGSIEAIKESSLEEISIIEGMNMKIAEKMLAEL